MNGVLLNAFNTPEFNYLEIAMVNATLVKANMQCGTAVVTDSGSLEYLKTIYSDFEIDAAFDYIIIGKNHSFQNKKMFRNGNKSNKVLQWNNMHQTSVFDITPFDETIVIDVDYLILDSSLNRCWGSNTPFMMNKNITTFGAFERFANYTMIANDIPHYWSTCFYFNKSEESKTIFKLVTHIKDNYSYYAKLYGFASHVYRNDFAFSIALHTISGYTVTNDFSFHNTALVFTSDFDMIDDVSPSGIIFALEKTGNLGEYFPLKIDTNVHVMNKYAIADHAKTIMEVKPCAVI